MLVVNAFLYQKSLPSRAPAGFWTRQFLNRFDGFFASRDHRWNRQPMADHLVALGLSEVSWNGLLSVRGNNSNKKQS
jgi:hypothetical protein